MHVLPPDRVATTRPTDADRVLARMNRIAQPNQGPDRPSRDQVRDGDASRRRHGTGPRGGFHLGAWGWLLIEVVAVASIVGAVLVWPPVSVCREQEAAFGFYSGDTLGKCVRRGVAARLDGIDQRIKMAVRGSGG